MVNISDEEFKATWPYTYADLIAWCKNKICDFKQSNLFYEAKRYAENNIKNMYERRLDKDNPNHLAKSIILKLVLRL